MAAPARNVSTEVTLARVPALDEVPAWSVRLRSRSRSRSRSRLRTSAKVHLADPSLACASLGVGPDRLARDPELFGFVLESMVVRDVRAYASARGGQTYHYRDNTGLEIDVVVEYPMAAGGPSRPSLVAAASSRRSRVCGACVTNGWTCRGSASLPLSPS